MEILWQTAPYPGCQTELQAAERFAREYWAAPRTIENVEQGPDGVRFEMVGGTGRPYYLRLCKGMHGQIFRVEVP